MRSVFSLLLILCLLLCGCAKEEAVLPDPTVMTAAEPEIPELAAFGEVLRGDRRFVDTLTGNHLDISQISQTVTVEDIPCSVLRIALTDLDRDGAQEALLRLKLGQDEYAGFEVLRYRDGEVYGYSFSYRSFLEPKADGTFRLSGGAFYSGIGRLAFEGSSATVIPLAERVEDPAEDSTSPVLYSIDGKPATEADFLAMDAQQTGKADVIWYETWEDLLSSR